MNNILILITNMGIGGSQTQTIAFSRFLKKLKKTVYIGSGRGPLLPIIKSICDKHLRLFLPSIIITENDQLAARQGLYYYFRILIHLGLIGICKLFFSLIKISYFLRTHKIDLIYANQPTGTIISYIAHQLTGIPFVLHVRGILTNEFPPPFYSHISMKAKAIIVDSMEIKQRLITTFALPADRIFIIGYYIDYDKLAITPPRTSEHSMAPTITMITTYHPNKVNGILTFIDSINDVLAVYKHCKFQIIGSGGDFYNIVRARAKQINTDAHSQVLSLIGASINISQQIIDSHIIVGNGSVVIESLLNHRPVIVTSHYAYGGIATKDNLPILLEANYTARNITAPLSSDTLASDILKLLNNNDGFYDSVVSEGCDFIASQYSFDRRHSEWDTIEKMVTAS